MATPRTRTRPRRFAYTLLWLLTLALAGFTGWRLFGTDGAWPLVVALSVTPYIAVAAVLPVGLAVWLRSMPLLTVVVLCVCALTVVLIPRAFTDDLSPGSGPRLEVMTVNIRTGDADLAVVADLVDKHDIDVLAVQELTAEAADRVADTDIVTQLPHQVLKPAAKGAGTGIYSRHELTDNPDLAPPGLFHSPAATIDVPDYGEVEFLAVHTAPPLNLTRIHDWRADLRALPAAPAQGPPRILAGDFNATLDHKLLRELIDTGYTDAADATGNGLTGTWPLNRPYLPKVTIDHILTSTGITPARFAAHTIPDSDHRAVTTTLTLPTPEN